MKKLFLLSISLLSFIHFAFGQTRSVVFNYDQSNFDNNQPLPVATNFVITGPVNNQVTMVEVKIFTDKPKSNEDPLYQSVWKQNSAKKESNFFIPINFKLKSMDYDVVVNYYRMLDQNEVESIRQDLFDALDAYLQQSRLNKPRLKLLKKTQETLDDLNSIVNSASVYHKNIQNIKFPGFSDITREKIKSIESITKRTAKHRYPELNNNQALIQYHQDQVDELKLIVKSEASYILNTGLSVLADSKYVDNYPVEATRTILTLHGGYGGVYLGGGAEDLSYGSGFRAGLTFPLGRKAYASKFWSNSAIIAGFYFNNFENANDVKVSGPIFKRPTYVGLGYKVFNFIRISGGATFLENQDTAGGLGNLGNKVFIRPFIGIQADLNFWMELAR